ncbi:MULTISPECIES: hypothetical protein [Streptomyces]|uniref:Uncharacterized protein n=1 Tax=Streptomyces eurythermus TaxID=42237 RepID=A0ABW6Z938_9ACTN|nr:hypothetical protein [Streptomyces sp. DSM 40868]QIS75536.1 hypothetical protein HB370_41075 [Streptomyces sp. DSM 40868]
MTSGGGRLVDVLAPAAPLLESVDTSGARPALLAVRRLLDALAVDAASLLAQDG